MNWSTRTWVLRGWKGAWAVLLIAVVGAGCTGDPAAPAGTSPASSSAASAPAETPGGSTSAPASESPASSSPAATPTPTPVEATLPRGGREVFPRYRLVGYSGLTGAKTLGRLGTGPLDQRVREMEERAEPYADGREIMPVLEIIATIVQPGPGSDGKYRSRISDDKIETYLKAARKGKGMLLLNIQPGRSSFMAEAKAYEKWLQEPDVGLALDPEWAMGRGEVPGRTFGSTTGAALDDVATYLSEIVASNDLPEKVLVYHQLSPRIVRQESELKDHPGVALVKSVDGIGSPGAKEATYDRVNKTLPKHVHAGFKLFYTEDEESSRLMTPKEVLALDPRPEYVLFE